jgi:hypothetical protein
VEVRLAAVGGELSKVESRAEPEFLALDLRIVTFKEERKKPSGISAALGRGN